MATETIKAEWKNKRIAKQKVQMMKTMLNGEYKTLVDNTVDFVGKGIVEFSPAGPESRRSIEMLVGFVNGKNI